MLKTKRWNVVYVSAADVADVVIVDVKLLLLYLLVSLFFLVLKQ